ncbi:response regulator transcription factor [Streptomyces sp. Qhu-G9]|uniref:response regulator transcription factor n=1 Tax=Streptomyces sp. Qhu-G9 TaxID=3452799 RepID=UPI0022AC255D|nr:response regulator transcription factor [Streptomyces aurantiacus]WAU78811.1 response regulator transcription factor [Streptomyces aurantiacus]
MRSAGEDEALRTLRSLEALKASPARIILVDRLSESGTRRLLRGGAHGILLSNDSVNHLAWAVRAAVAGSIALAPEAARLMVDRYLQPIHEREEVAVARARMALLSPREYETLTLLCEGLSNPTVAENLSISEHTVKDHIRAIYSKLGVDNRVQAAHIAWQAQYQSWRQAPY